MEAASDQFGIKIKVINYATMITCRQDWSLTGDQDKRSFISWGLYSLCPSSKLDRLFQQIKQQLKTNKVEI